MACQRCKSDRILDINAKCSDCCYTVYKDMEQDGYVPTGVGIGGDDYVEFSLCLECGQLQGTFPIREAAAIDALVGEL